MDIVAFRTQYPEYNDMSDQVLSDSLYDKHYSDMPKEDFLSKFTPPPEPDLQAIEDQRETEKALNFISTLSPEQRQGPTEGPVGFETSKEVYGEDYSPIPIDELAKGAIAETGRAIKGVARGAAGTLEGMAGATEWLTEGAIGKDLADKAREWQTYLSPEAIGKKSDFRDDLSSGVGSMATFFVPGLGIAKGVGAMAKISPKLAAWLGTGTATSMEAATEAGIVYRNVLEKTGRIEDAEKAATQTFWYNVPLLAVTNKLGVFASKGGPIRKGIVASQMEGGQEAGQEYISGEAEGRNVTLGEYVSAYGVGAITGGGVGLMTGSTAKARGTVTPTSEAPLQEAAPEQDPILLTEEIEKIPVNDKSIMQLNSSHKTTLEAVRAEIAQGEAGERFATETEEGTVSGAIPSTFPEYFKNKGYKKDDTLRAVDKALAGKPLTKLQQILVEDLNQGYRQGRLNNLLKDRQETEVTAWDLNEGDTFKRDGETYKVKKVDEDGFLPEVEIKNSETFRIEGDETIGMDRGTLKQTEKQPVVSGMRQGEGVETIKPETSASTQAYAPGENYTGTKAEADEGSTPSTKEAVEKPIRREDVLKPLLKALKIPLYEGKVKGKNRLGFYRSVVEETRIKNKSDIEVAAHEIAHLLDDRIPEIKKSWRPHVKELRSISYDKKKTSEGFAEFVRLWMTQKDKALETAPEYSKWFENFIETSEYGPALKEAQTGMHNWYAQGALARAKSKTGPQDNINDVHNSITSNFRQSIADDLHGVYEMEKQLSGEIKPVGAYEKMRLTRAHLAIVNGMIEQGHIVIKEGGGHDFEGKGWTEIFDPIANDLDNWVLYAVGRSAGELMTQGRENLFTRSEIQAMKNLETPAFKKAFDEYQVWNKAVVDFAEQKGLINPQSRKLWRRMQYLPFYREGGKGQTKRKKGIEGNYGGIQALTGGTNNLSDILGNMIQNASGLIGESLKNEARVEVARLSQSPGGARFMAKIPKAETPTTVDKGQIESFVYGMLGLTKSDIQSGRVPKSMIDIATNLEKQFSANPDFIQFWQFGQAPKGDNVIAVLKKGKPEYYEVADPLLYRAIASLNRPGKNTVVKILSTIKRIGQTAITLTPDFMGANMARDTLMGAIISRSGFRPFIDSIVGMKSRIMKDKNYREFIANGGGFSSYFVDEAAFKKHIERFYTKKGISYKTVIDSPAKLLYFLESVADSFEISTRLGEFKRAIRKGEHPRHAAYRAREVSTDFAMRGDSEVANFFFDTVMFLKAGINGIDRLYRGISHDPNRGAIAVKVAALAAMSTVLYLLNKDNEEYEDLEEWDKDSYWHFFVPKKDGYTHFRYPKLWEVGAIASIAERTAENVIKGNPKKLAEDFTRIALSQFKLSLIPHALKPLYEQSKNKIGFTGRPIETPHMQDLQPWARGYVTGNKSLKDIARKTRDFPRGLQLPPARTEALLRGYFSTWAMYGLSLSDAIFYDDIPDLRVDQYPVLRRFYRQSPARRTKYETMYYDMLKEATELRRTMREMSKTLKDVPIAYELADKPYLALYKPLKDMQVYMSDIRTMQNNIYDDPDKTPEQKRREIDKLVDKKNKTLKEVMLKIKESEAENK